MASTAPSPFPINNNHEIHRPNKSNRKPLQPRNTPSTPLIPNREHEKAINISLTQNSSNKENIHPKYISTPKNEEKLIEQQPFADSSLAEELNAIREKLERLRIDREETDRMLRERDLMLDLQMKEILNRGEMQKQLELEVDRLFRLNELRLLSFIKIYPIRTLREKEEEKKINGDHLKELNYDEEDSSSENNSSA